MEAPPPIRPRFACRQITTAATQCLLQDDHLRTLDNVENPQNRQEISQHAQDSQDYQVLFHIASSHRPTNRVYPWSRIALPQNPAPVRRLIYVPCVTYSCRTAERG